MPVLMDALQLLQRNSSAPDAKYRKPDVSASFDDFLLFLSKQSSTCCSRFHHKHCCLNAMENRFSMPSSAVVPMRIKNQHWKSHCFAIFWTPALIFITTTSRESMSPFSLEPVWSFDSHRQDHICLKTSIFPFQANNGDTTSKSCRSLDLYR